MRNDTCLGPVKRIFLLDYRNTAILIVEEYRAIANALRDNKVYLNITNTTNIAS